MEDINIKNIKTNWNNYENNISKETYEILWNDTIKKFDINENNYYFIILRNFIDKKKFSYKNDKIVLENENILILKGLDGEERKEIHKLCDKIGLHHRSIKKKKKKHLYIYKPEVWLWEFSEKNPYSESDELYKQREIQSQIRKEKKLAEMKNEFCDECGANGLEKELFISVYIQGIYCDDCLEIVDDGSGEPLSCHKFETIKFFYN
jgi:hypothetical protein